MRRASSLALLALAACTGRTVEPDPACNQEERVAAVESGEGDAVAWLGAVRLSERVDLEANSAVVATAGASFYDVRDFRSEQPAPLELSATCVGITGQPAQTGTRTALAVDHVEITGLVGGARTLSTADGGSLSLPPASALFSTDPVQVRVTGTDGGFVDVEFTALTPPRRVEVSAPDLSGSKSLAGEDLELKWGAGDPSGAVAIDLVTGAGSAQTRAVVSCVVKDDGCHVIPSSAITWLAAGGTDPITVTLRRSVGEGRVLAAPVDGGAGASVGLSVETRGKVLP